MRNKQAEKLANAKPTIDSLLNEVDQFLTAFITRNE